MTASTFTWYPDSNTQLSEKPRVSVAKFGDGYENRAALGINIRPDSWKLVFTRSRSEALDILSFLRARNGLESFIWANPLEESGTYVCREWSMTPDRGICTVTCTFERVYE